MKYLVLIITFIIPINTYAVLVTDTSQFTNNVAVIDFSQFSGQRVFGPGLIQVGSLVGENIMWSANNTGSIILGEFPDYGLGNNGIWTNEKIFVGLNGQPDNLIHSMRFMFLDGPINAVGGELNYTPNREDLPTVYSNALISALDINGNVIEEYNLLTDAPISTPNGANEGLFRGILRQSDDIYGFKLENSVMVIDDLTFSRINPIPIPPAIILFSSSLFGFIAISSRKS